MKKLITALLLVPVLAVADPVLNAGEVPASMARVDVDKNAVIPAGAAVILRTQLGSGTPGFTGLEPAVHMGEGVYHAPQYMAAFPTASTLFPRVVDVMCQKSGVVFVCDGYNWTPALGRGEYLFFRPKLAPPPVVVTKEVPVPAPYPVYVEKKIKKE